MHRRTAFRVLGLSTSSFFASCNGFRNPGANMIIIPEQSTERSRPYIPLEAPEKLASFEKATPTGMEKVFFSNVDHKSMLRYLSITQMTASVQNSTISGNLGFLNSGITGERGHYKVVMDYGRYTHEEMASPRLAKVRVGVSIRVVANVTTTKFGVNIADLPAIKLGANRRHLQGTFDISTVGINSSAIDSLMPKISAVDEQAINNVIEFIEKVNLLVRNPETELIPHLLAEQQIA